MPFSSTTFDTIFRGNALSIKPTSMLDVGAGAGKYGKIIKELFPKCALQAIEPTEGYVEEYKLRDTYDRVHRKTIHDYCNENAHERHDLVVFGDVLEHFYRSQAIDLLDYFLYRAGWVIAIWPSNMPQDAWHGNAFEIHKSNFSLNDLASKFDVQYYTKAFGWFHWNDAEMTHCWYNYAVMRGYVTKRNVSLC